VRVHDDHLYPVQVVDHGSVLPRQRPIPAATEVTADPDAEAAAAGHGHAPAVEQVLVDLFERRAHADREGPVARVEADLVARRHVQQDLDVAVVHEVLEAVPAAADGELLAGPDGLLDRLDRILGRADHPGVLGPSGEPFVLSTLHEIEVPHVRRPDLLTDDGCGRGGRRTGYGECGAGDGGPGQQTSTTDWHVFPPERSIASTLGRPAGHPRPPSG
jgi:hypothetical protein